MFVDSINLFDCRISGVMKLLNKNLTMQGFDYLLNDCTIMQVQSILHDKQNKQISDMADQ